jgi:hypothetical protein
LSADGSGIRRCQETGRRRANGAIVLDIAGDVIGHFNEWFNN